MPHYLQLNLKQRQAIFFILQAKKALKEVSTLSKIEYSTLTRTTHSHWGNADADC